MCTFPAGAWSSAALPADLRPNGTQEQTLTVPQTGLYRVELRGAQGGSLPGHEETNNRGGAVLTSLRLVRGQQLKFLVGRQGASPCALGFRNVISNKTSVS